MKWSNPKITLRTASDPSYVKLRKGQAVGKHLIAVHWASKKIKRVFLILREMAQAQEKKPLLVMMACTILQVTQRVVYQRYLLLAVLQVYYDEIKAKE